MTEKSEQPTPKRLRDARQKGQVAKSQEIGSCAILASVTAVIWTNWSTWMEHLRELIRLPSELIPLPFGRALPTLLDAVLVKAAQLCLPILVTVMVTAILANFFQIGALFALEAIKPSLKKLSPTENIKKIVSVKNLMELVKSIIKIFFLGFLLYLIIRDSIDPLIKIPYIGIHAILSVLGSILLKMMWYTVLAFSVIATADFVFQKHQHIKQLKMTKDEVKREFKEMEGDPLIKSKRKQLHQELGMSDTLERVKKSTVLVVNPTHVAVALYYDKEKTRLPVVLAKGENMMAQKMIETAKKHGIPIMRNVPLARDLYEGADINQFIPSELIRPVAEVLRWVQQLQSNIDEK